MNDLKDLISRKKTGDKIENATGQTEMDMDWPQTANAYELKAQIGQGAFAKVWQAHCAEKGVDVAIKIMELDNLTSSLEDIYQEVRVMVLSKNPCVLRAYACFAVKRSLWLIMPLMRKGSCLRIMKVLKRSGLGDGMKEEWIATILKSALIGLEYFHQQGKIHRDIKASNLLMDSDGSVMISDFGVAGWLPNGGIDRKEGERRTFVGTPCWMAPEVMEQTRPYDEKADIWSFGITALELAKGYAPYAKLQPMRVLLMTIQNPPPSLKSYEDYQKTKNKFSRHFREIITLCLQKNPMHRPSASTLLTKTFFKRAPANSSLVKDLLDAVPIRDTWDGSVDTQSPEAREQLKNLEAIRADQQEEVMKMQMKNDASIAADSAPLAPVSETSEAAPPVGQPQQQQPPEKMAKIVAKLEGAAVGSSFVRGSTWVFSDNEDEDDEKAAQMQEFENLMTEKVPVQVVQPPVPAPPAPVVDPSPLEDSGFQDFMAEYEKMDLKGEDGKTISDATTSADQTQQ